MATERTDLALNNKYQELYGDYLDKYQLDDTAELRSIFFEVHRRILIDSATESGDVEIWKASEEDRDFLKHMARTYYNIAIGSAMAQIKEN